MAWEQAVALVELEVGGEFQRSGTAFLVAPELALTALHVVGDRSVEPAKFWEGRIQLRFRGHVTDAEVFPNRFDCRADWVLLRLRRTALLTPLRLYRTPSPGAKWEARGFPDAEPSDGMTIGGIIRSVSHTIRGVRALALFCEEASAGAGLPVKGLSGAPVIAGGGVIGLLRRALLEEGSQVDLKEAPPRSRGGTLYACPTDLILDHCGDLLAAHEPNATRGRIPLQRPRRPEHFTGREKELSELQNDLEPGRVVTLCGLGGVGKTALAIALLWALAPGDDPPERFPDGIVFHSFSDQRTAAEALTAIARAFGEDSGQDPPNLAAQRALEGRTALLVLDAVENAEDIGPILALSAWCGVLLTTRERDRGAGDLRDTENLHFTQGVRLLQALGAEYIDDPTSAHTICELLGGLPLAIRLAGHYMGTRKVYAREYLEWLKQSPLDALHHGQRQHESVPLVISRTIEQLSQRAREALAVVGLLAPAPLGADAIEVALALTAHERTRALGELVNYGLLSRENQAYEVGHALVHTYARESLSIPGEALERLAKHFTGYARRPGRTRTTANDEIDAVRPHITALLPRLWDGSLSECAVDLVRILVPAGESFLRARGYRGDEAHYLTRALEVCAKMGEQTGGRDHQHWLRRTAELKEALGDLFFFKDEYETAEAAFRYSLSAYCQLDDSRPEQVQTKLKLAEIVLNRGNFNDVLQLLEGVPDECGRLPQQSDTLALAYSILGRAYHGKEVYSKAETHYLDSLTYYQGASYGAERARVLVRLSSLRFDQRLDQEAAAYLQQAEECLTNAKGSLRSLAQVRGDIASHYLWRKDYEKASNLNEQTLKDFRQIGDRQFIGWTLQRQGDIHFEQGSAHDVQARTAYAEAVRIFEELGILNGQAYAFDHLAQIELRLGKYSEAQELFEKALDRFDRSGLRSGKGYVYGNLGDLAQAKGNQEAARYYYREALSIWEELCHSNQIALTKTKVEGLESG
jgi:tetratricopeptide (TPR) repeat protein